MLLLSKFFNVRDTLMVGFEINASSSLPTITENKENIQHTIFFNVSRFIDIRDDVKEQPFALMFIFLWLQIVIGFKTNKET